MNGMKRGLALVLCLAVLCTAGLTSLLAASQYTQSLMDRGHLGVVSAKYESSGDPGAYATVPGDLGGPSYGLYMFIEDSVVAFFKWCRSHPTNARYREIGDILYDAYYNPSLVDGGDELRLGLVLEAAQGGKGILDDLHGAAHAVVHRPGPEHIPQGDGVVIHLKAGNGALRIGDEQIVVLLLHIRQVPAAMLYCKL